MGYWVLLQEILYGTFTQSSLQIRSCAVSPGAPENRSQPHFLELILNHSVNHESTRTEIVHGFE